MNALNITGIEQLVLGVYLIAHGLIYLMFLFYFKDKDKNTHTGWSGKSLLSSVLPENINKISGKIMWLLTSILFAVSGIGVLDILDLKDVLIPVLILASIIGIIAHLIYWVGLSPTPYHWVLGLVINIAILFFVIFLFRNIPLLVYLLIAIWVYGMLLHTKVLSIFIHEESYS